MPSINWDLEEVAEAEAANGQKSEANQSQFATKARSKPSAAHSQTQERGQSMRILGGILGTRGRIDSSERNTKVAEL